MSDDTRWGHCRVLGRRRGRARYARGDALLIERVAGARSLGLHDADGRDDEGDSHPARPLPACACTRVRALLLPQLLPLSTGSLRCRWSRRMHGGLASAPPKRWHECSITLREPVTRRRPAP